MTTKESRAKARKEELDAVLKAWTGAMNVVIKTIQDDTAARVKAARDGERDIHLSEEDA